MDYAVRPSHCQTSIAHPEKVDFIGQSESYWWRYALLLSLVPMTVNTFLSQSNELDPDSTIYANFFAIKYAAPVACTVAHFHSMADRSLSGFMGIPATSVTQSLCFVPPPCITPCASVTNQRHLADGEENHQAAAQVILA